MKTKTPKTVHDCIEYLRHHYDWYGVKLLTQLLHPDVELTKK